MNDWQRRICDRVKLIREQVRWSQSDFALQLGLTIDLLASIEYCRTPLRYDLAWRLRELFGVSLNWLVENDRDPDAPDFDEFPPPSRTGLSSRALLTEVFVHIQQQKPARQASPVSFSDASSLLDSVPDMQQRQACHAYLQSCVTEWISSAPTGAVYDLVDTVAGAGMSFLQTRPREPAAEIDRRYQELIWNRIRSATARKSIVEKNHTQGLTHLSEIRKVPEVKLPTIQQLLDTTRKIVKPSGMKAALAAHLGVPQSRVSEWLGGKYEPSGSVALRLLEWVTDPARKQNTPGSASNTPRGKTQRKASSEENQSKDRQKPS